MDFLKPIAGALKKYTALLPSITITVVALLLLLPTMLIGSKVKEKMETSTKTAQTVQQLSGNVPSKKGPQRIQNYMDKLEASADKIKQYAVQSSQRDLVTYDYVIFPKPLDRSSQIFTEFGKRYRIAVEKLLEKMKALDAPSGDEIRAEIGGSAKQPGTVDVEDPAANAFCLTRAQEIFVYANPSAFRWYKFWEKYEFSGEDQALEDCWDSQVAFW
ncbi:MAG: inner membrane CreD family protein, partial [Planctomycetota bacterium]